MSFVSAEVQNLGTFKIDNCVNLVQVGAGFQYCNITSILAPDSSKVLGEVEMTKVDNNYNYTFCQPEDNGQYIVTGFCSDGNTSVWAYNFDVTGSGSDDFNTFWILVVALILAGILIVYGFIREEYPPITIGGVLLLVSALYIWVEGFGTFGATELIPRFVAAALFLVGATLSIKSLSELN